MNPENYLLEMGVAGVWILSLIYDKYIFQKDIKHLIRNNTNALIKFEKFIENNINGRNH